jgi:hypothetical protein
MAEPCSARLVASHPPVSQPQSALGRSAVFGNAVVVSLLRGRDG